MALRAAEDPDLPPNQVHWREPRRIRWKETAFRPEILEWADRLCRPEPAVVECRVRVLMITTSVSGHGGIERFGRDLARALEGPPAEHAIRVLALDQGVKRSSGRIPLSAKGRLILRALSAVAGFRPDVVVAGHVSVAPLAAVCALLAKTTWVTCCYGREVWTRLGLAERLALRYSTEAWVISNFTRERAATANGIDLQHMHLVQPCVARLPPPPQDVERVPLRVIAVGRLTPESRYKGFDTLLRAWPDVLRTAPQAELVIVGDGPDRDYLERLAGGELNRSIRFSGAIDDASLAVAYAGAGVFCLPARSEFGGEGLGLVALEAAAAGLPVVVGRSGGLPETLLEGVTGMSVDPSDPAALVQALLRFLGSPSLATGMGRAGREFADANFSFGRFEAQVRSRLGRLATPGTSPAGRDLRTSRRR